MILNSLQENNKIEYSLIVPEGFKTEIINKSSSEIKEL